MAQVGIVYKPQQTTGSTPPTLQSLRLAEREVSYIRIQWVDLINCVCFRILPVAYFVRLCETARPGVCLTKATLGFVGIIMAEGFTGTGEHLYAIDLSSFRLCPYAPGHAVVMGWFQEKIPPPSGVLTVPFCPRTLLQGVLNEAKAKAGLSFLAGFEHEFILLSATSPKLVTVNDAGYSCSAKSRTGTVEYVVMEEIANALQAADIELQMVHAEAAPGQVGLLSENIHTDRSRQTSHPQFEVITGPLTPLEAADAVVHTRETIYNIASKHGLRATFAPRLHADNCTSAPAS